MRCDEADEIVSSRFKLLVHPKTRAGEYSGDHSGETVRSMPVNS